MKFKICIVLIFWNTDLLLAQIEPFQSSTEELKTLNVKTVSAYFYPAKDTAEVEGKLILKKEYDPEGKILEKYLLSLWEAVSYSNTTTYSYNGTGSLSQETSHQKILNLGKRDQEYIESFGDSPLNEKIKYEYNRDGQLIKKEIFIFSAENPGPTDEPSQTVIYEYDSATLITEKSSTPNIELFNQSFNIEREYDHQKNLTRMIKTYGLAMENRRITEFHYDSANHLIEKIITDTGIPRNNEHFKYVYNESGKVLHELIFDKDEGDFIIETSYGYDQKGNMISGEREVEYTYYDNGLVRSESWQDDVTDENFLFVTIYEFD